MAKRGPKKKEKGKRKKAATRTRGKRGPAKTPAAKLKLHNSRLAAGRQKTEDRRQNLEGDTVPFPNSMPQRPSWCSYKRKAIWDNLIDMYRLRYPNLLDEIDVYVLARYCDLLAWYIKLRNDVTKEGEVKTLFNKQGGEYLSTNPKAALAIRITPQLTKLENELFLSPSARQGLVLGKKEDAKNDPNSLAAYLSRSG